MRSTRWLRTSRRLTEPSVLSRAWRGVAAPLSVRLFRCFCPPSCRACCASAWRFSSHAAPSARSCRLWRWAALAHAKAAERVRHHSVSDQGLRVPPLTNKAAWLDHMACICKASPSTFARTRVVESKAIFLSARRRCILGPFLNHSRGGASCAGTPPPSPSPAVGIPRLAILVL